ncbi:MAG: hypothetical protein P8X96_14265 [Desulfobacteraceae bacterium]
MEKKSVPQDANKTYDGYGTKVVYAVDEAGRYDRVRTTGWEVEEIVLRDVVDDFEQKAESARRRAMSGQTSPIEYFMHKRYLDLTGLAKGMGIAKWRVKRHLKPSVFDKLSQSVLQRYAELFDIDPKMLTHFKENL